MVDNELLQAIADVIEEKLESKLEEKLESKLEEKLESKLEEKLDSKLENKLESKLDEKLHPIYDRLDKIESDVAAVKSAQVSMKKDIKAIDQKVSDTYDLALDAWGTSFENRRLIEEG